MDVVGSEIGQKMRSAIKAKLTELGCYVDDELPDYVMVMVANKRTRAQMEDDLQLFLSENTELFVNWLHTVLKKLQEVTVTTPVVSIEPEKSKEKSSKEKKTKEKKDKTKKGDLKKAKKKDKEKSHRKKEEKKLHKSKKKSKHHGMIRPNIPPLLMNMEKESEPSITDVFAGQILKNHGITIESLKEDKVIEEKVIVKDVKRPIVNIIDPATISSQSEPMTDSQSSTTETTAQEPAETSTIIAPRDEQIKEMNEIEAKIIGLKQKLAEQLDSMSDDEDFLNIRTEAEELMNDFAEDVFQEISSHAPIATPPTKPESPTPTPIPALKPPEISKEPPRPKDLTELPQIELKLPKRPVRERLGAREAAKILEAKQKRTESPERFTPDREPDFWGKTKSAKSRLGEHISETKRTSVSEDSDISDSSSKKILSKVSSQPERPRVSCASVVRVRPRPRVAPSSSLLMRAMADAHKSLLNIPPKVDSEPQKVKRAMVLPMRRTVDAQNIVIQVPQTSDAGEKLASEKEKEEYVPASITKKIINTDYVPSRRGDRTTTRRDDTLIIETINIHNPTVDKDKDTQFIVTMDGFNPNAFLAKKLLTEGLLNEDEVEDLPKTPAKSVLKTKDKDDTKEKTKEKNIEDKIDIETEESILDSEEVEPKISGEMKRLSGTSEDSDTIVIIKPEKEADSKLEKRSNDEDKRFNDGKDKRRNEGADKRKSDTVEKRKSDTVEKRTALTPERIQNTEETNITETRNSDIEKEASSDESSKNETDDSPPMKKRKASPIVFDVGKKEKEVEKERDRQRTESAGSDNHVIVTTVTNASKYDSVPPLSSADRKPAWCRSFPLCRYGAACLFLHPRCKFAAGCTRRGCIYSHDAPAAPALASHVVPAANFKTITNNAMAGVCKFYPNCVNPACHFYHPKPCRYGKACVNKLECNFYHHDVPKWRFSV